MSPTLLPGTLDNRSPPIHRGAQTRPSLHTEFEKLNNHHRAELMGQDAQQLFATATAGNNHRKNRYADILALEATRVKLKAHRELLSDDSDYINANYIDGEVPGSQRAYIACQAPLPATLSHFWLMIWVRLLPCFRWLLELLLTEGASSGKRGRGHCHAHAPHRAEPAQGHGLLARWSG